MDSDPTTATALLDEMGRDVQQALVEAGRLADRIYPPLLEAGGLAAGVRAAAASAGVRIRIEVSAGEGCPPEIAGAVYFCCLEALECAGHGARATVTVRDEPVELVFEVLVDGAALVATDSGKVFSRSRDRVEALGGRLSIQPQPGGGLRFSGVLPRSR